MKRLSGIHETRPEDDFRTVKKTLLRWTKKFPYVPSFLTGFTMDGTIYWEKNYETGRDMHMKWSGIDEASLKPKDVIRPSIPRVLFGRRKAQPPTAIVPTG